MTGLTELKWALIFTVVALAWMVLERMVGLHGAHIDKHAVYTNLFAIPAVAVYVFALRDKRRRDLGGVMNYRRGFMCGLLITGLIVLLSPLSQLVTHKVITPVYFPNVIAYAVQTDMMTREAAEAYFNLGNYIKQSAIFGAVVGVITSAIVAIFTRKDAGIPVDHTGE